MSSERTWVSEADGGRTQTEGSAWVLQVLLGSVEAGSGISLRPRQKKRFSALSVLLFCPHYQTMLSSSRIATRRFIF